MFEIVRSNTLGYVTWGIYHEGNCIVVFDSYYDAVDFVLFMNEV